MASKTAFVFPAVRAHNHSGHAGTYYTLMMSTGLTFGTISALFGLNHQIITQAQYSFLVGTVIASAVLPTLDRQYLLPASTSPPSQNPGRKAPAGSPDARHYRRRSMRTCKSIIEITEACTLQLPGR